MGTHANRAYAEVTMLRWRGHLDVDVMRASLQVLVDRHEALRTTIDANGETQTVHARVTVDVPFVDMSDAAAGSAAQRAALARQFADVEAFTFDLSVGPIFRGRILRISQDEHLLLLTFHHVLDNGPSYSRFFDELCEVYAARREGRAPHLEEAMQLHEFVRWQRNGLD